MSVRITSLIMILALTATVVAGVPLHPSERGCTMPDVEMKDCGKLINEPTSPGIAHRFVLPYKLSGAWPHEHSS